MDRQTDRHESENRGHPFRVSGFFSNFLSTYHQGVVQYAFPVLEYGGSFITLSIPDHYQNVPDIQRNS